MRSPAPAPPPSWPDALRTLGEMGARVANHDWAATPLGPIGAWPTSLRVMARAVLASPYPMLLTWGEALTGVYNDAYVPILGAKHPAALGASARDTWADVWDGVGRQFEQALQGGEATLDEAVPFAMERYGFLEEAHFTFGISPARDDDGAPAGALSVCVEVTDEVVARRRLRLLRDLGARASAAATPQEACREIAQALGEAPADLPFALLYLPGPSGLVLGGAAGAPEGTALAPRAFNPADPEARWHLPKGHASCLVDRPDALAGLRSVPLGTPVRQALVLPLASGGRLVAGVSPSRPLDDGYRAFLHLLAEQVGGALRAAQALADADERARTLAELDRAKTTFFQNASHELRTPLTLLLGPLDDALDDERLPEAVREQLSLARRSARRLQRLADALLALTKAEAGALAATFEPVDLSALTAGLAGTFRSLTERAGLALSVDAEPLSEPVYVDPGMWETAVLNLLSNAFKHTFEGGIAVRVRARGTEAEVCIRDTGTGIPAAEVPRLFERFHRVPGTASRTHEGAGVGLALVHDIVALHGGRVDVASTLGEGSAFTVRLPLGAAHLPRDQVARAPVGSRSLFTRAQDVSEEAAGWAGDAPAPRPVSPPYPPRPRVLVADDNADLRAYIAQTLSASYEVEAVGDGEAALAAARARPPALVLADVMMPRLDGLGLLAALRADPATRALPVLLLSARAGMEARAEGLEAGADGYLTKPFASRELKARVSGLIDGGRRREAAALREALAALEARVTERSAEVVALTSTLVQAEQSERQRIADVLHDDVQQQLFGLGLKAHLLRASAPPALADGLDHLDAIIQRLVLTVRRLALQLSPPVLPGEGIEEALRWLAVQLQETQGLTVEVVAAGPLPTPAEPVRILLFQIARELLSNVARQSGTGRARVCLSERQGRLYLEVAASGGGAAPLLGESPDSEFDRAREQLRFLGGSLVLTSSPGTGTRASVSLPLDPSSPEPLPSPPPAAGVPR